MVRGGTTADQTLFGRMLEVGGVVPETGGVQVKVTVVGVELLDG